MKVIVDDSTDFRHNIVYRKSPEKEGLTLPVQCLNCITFLNLSLALSLQGAVIQLTGLVNPPVCYSLNTFACKRMCPNSLHVTLLHDVTGELDQRLAFN